MSFRDALLAMQQLRDEGVIVDYAIGGAMAMAFWSEAVREAVTLEVESLPARVIRPEHLIALYLEPSARTRKRLERVATLLDEGTIDRAMLDALLAKHGLTPPGGS